MLLYAVNPLKSLRGPKSVERNWSYLTSLKIDCLADNIFGFRIFEIKPVFDLKAIGQCLVYSSLLSTCYEVNKPISASIVTEAAGDEIKSVCKLLGISLYIQDIDFPSVP